MRVWRARINPARIEEYRRFESALCMPMLHKQAGFLAVLFFRQAGQAAAVGVVGDANEVQTRLLRAPHERGGSSQLRASALTITPNLGLLP